MGMVADMDRAARLLTRLTCHVIAERFKLENERNERRKRMAIEIKGLKADALTARANLDRLRAAYARFNELAPAHAADVAKMADDVTVMQSDLEFAANLLGNSAGASGEAVQRAAPVATAGDLNEPKPAPAPLNGQPSVSQERTGTFRAEAEQQIAAGHGGER